MTLARSLATLVVLTACSGKEAADSGSPADTDTDTDSDTDTDTDADTDADTDSDTDTDTDTDVHTATPTPPVYATLVRGALFTTDLVAAQSAHDALAAGGEAASRAAGDFAHAALTGSTLLGSTAPNDFLAIDRWDDDAAMAAFYADPNFAAAFSTLFSGPPTVESFEARPDWHNWGDLEAGDPGPYWFAVVRGHLAEADPAAAQAAHDAVAAYGEGDATAAGDVAHVVFTGLADPREFLAVDVWSSDAAIETLYTDPAFAAAFGALFDAPPSLQVYQSTTWHQW